MEKTDFIMKPKVDFCFKELMEDSEVRKGFISAVLKIHPTEVVETILIPTHLRKKHKKDKLGILDVCVRLNRKKQIDMEIQIASFPSWEERTLFYLSKMYTGNLSEGEDYDMLEKCIQVGILDFILFPEDEEYYSQFHFWEDNRKRMYSDKMEIHVLELPKLAEKEFPESELLNWAKFLSAERKEDLMQMAAKNEYIGKAYDRLAHISADEEKRLEYEAREKAIRDHNYLLKVNRKQGLEQGLEQGTKLGEERLIRLMQKMSEGPDAALIPNLCRDSGLLQQMYEKYKI